MALKEEKEYAFSGKQKDSVREEIVAVSGTMDGGRENCIFFERDHPESLLQEKCQSGEDFLL